MKSVINGPYAVTSNLLIAAIVENVAATVLSIGKELTDRGMNSNNWLGPLIVHGIILHYAGYE